MATILKSRSDIVSSHLSTLHLTSEELVQEINKVHAALQALDAGKKVDAAETEKAKSHVQV